MIKVPQFGSSSFHPDYLYKLSERLFKMKEFGVLILQFKTIIHLAIQFYRSHYTHRKRLCFVP